jgi:hypothetical protein
MSVMTYCITSVLGTGTLRHVTNDASLTQLFKYSQNNPHGSNKVKVWKQLAKLMYRNSLAGDAVPRSSALPDRLTPTHSRITFAETLAAFIFSELKKRTCISVHVIIFGSKTSHACPSGRAVYGVGVQPLACWDWGFDPTTGMDVCLLWVCLLTGRGLCDELITRPEESYPLWCFVVCDLETSWMRRPWPTGGCRAKNKQHLHTQSYALIAWCLVKHRVRPTNVKYVIWPR